jgi:hypothetical protein
MRKKSDHTDRESIETEIKDVYRLYKLKIKQIRELNTKCKIFVCPVLPSLDRNLNAKICCFNKLLLNDLVSSDYKVNIVRGFDVFCDRMSGQMKRELHNGEAGDTLHLGVKRGVPLLVRLIKQGIFSHKSNRGGHVTADKLYSDTAGQDQM